MLARSTPTRGWILMTRTGIVTALGMLLGAIAHGLAGGTVSPSSSLLLAASLAVPTALALRRRLTWMGLTIVLLASQWWVHSWLSATASHDHHHAMGAGSSLMTATGPAGDLPMLALHLAAAAATAAWLARGEEALFTLSALAIDRVRHLLGARLGLLTPVTGTDPRPAAVTWGRPALRVPRHVLLVDVITRRGPPPALLA